MLANQVNKMTQFHRADLAASVNAGSIDECIQLLTRGFMSPGMDQLAVHQAALQAWNGQILQQPRRDGGNSNCSFEFAV